MPAACSNWNDAPPAISRSGQSRNDYSVGSLPLVGIAPARMSTEAARIPFALPAIPLDLSTLETLHQCPAGRVLIDATESMIHVASRA